MDCSQLYISTVSAGCDETAARYGLGLEIAEYCTAANLDGCGIVGVAALGADNHTGACAHQKVLSRGGEAGLHFVGLHNADGAGGVGFLHHAVADNHKFAHVHRVGFELDVDFGAVVHRYFLGVATDVGEYEHSVGRYLDGVVTVEVGGYTEAGGTLHRDACADGGLAFGLIHST